MPKKSDEDFFNEILEFFFENGKKLKNICPECFDEYNDHSLLKLICIKYWVDMFVPIAHRQLGDKHGYTIAFVDSMAGSGITTTKRAGDYLIGSSPSAILSAQNKGFPFNLIIINEKNRQKTNALNERIKEITDAEMFIFNDDILEVSKDISNILKKQTISFIVIDPHGLQGIKWESLHQLLSCKGDAIVTWFEDGVWRVRSAALSSKENLSLETDKKRLNELFGDNKWMNASNPTELTNLFINRVMNECNKGAYKIVKIPRERGNYYHIILFTGKFRTAEQLSQNWKDQVERRIKSAHGKDISSLLDVKAGRKAKLDDFF